MTNGNLFPPQKHFSMSIPRMHTEWGKKLTLKIRELELDIFKKVCVKLHVSEKSTN